MEPYDIRAPKYRYITTDLLTNQVLAEVEATGVSYSRGLKTAGSFSGNVAIIPGKTNGQDLYQATLPGRTGLYVLRNDVCVWGGILWSRSYDLVSKTMGIEAQEFVSYLHHRVIWKTFSTSVGAKATADGSDYIKLDLDIGLGPGTIQTGSKVRLIFPNSTEAKFNTNYEVYDQPNNKQVRVKAKVAGATITHTKIAKKVVTVYTSAAHGFKAGERVSMVIAGGAAMLNGTRVVKKVTSKTSFYYEDAKSKNTKVYAKKKMKGTVAPVGVLAAATYTNVTMQTRMDTFDYVRGLLNATFNDFTGIEFAIGNTPGIGYLLNVASYSNSQGTTTVTTDDPHDLAIGQQVLIRNTDTRIDGQWIVTDTPTDTSFQFLNPGQVTIPLTTETLVEATITKTRRSKQVATLTAPGHGLSIGDLITVTDAETPDIVTTTKNGVTTKTDQEKDTYNGTFTVIAPTNSTVFSYEMRNNANSKRDKKTDVPAPAGALVENRAEVVVGTYGSFTPNASIGIDFEVNEDGSYPMSGTNVPPRVYRGGEVETVGEALEAYADGEARFEYRIDCTYDPDLQQFSRTFKLLPIEVPDPPDLGEVSPLSRFGADRLVFEHPGNISALTVAENAEQSATRFFMTGATAGAEGNPYYAGAAAVELLTPTDGSRPWPIIDASEANSEESDQTVLYAGAERYLMEAKPPIINLSLSVNGSIDPVVGSYAPGDWCAVIIDDDFVRTRLSSGLETREDVLVRKIQEYSVVVPDGVAFPEDVTLTLVPEWEVDPRG